MHRTGVLRRGPLGPATLTAAVMTAATLSATAAAAAPAHGEHGAGGGDGVRIRLSQAEAIAPGQTITVEGTGLDPNAGYYVATCVTGTGGPAGPECAGDRAVRGSQLWVSNSGRGATTPIAPDGTFTDDLSVVASGTAMSGRNVDCSEQECAVTVFYDHRNGFATLAQAPITIAAADAAQHARGSRTGANTQTDTQAAAEEAAQEAPAADGGGSAAAWWGVGGGILVVVLGSIGAVAYSVRRNERRH